MQSTLPEHLDFIQKADLGAEITGVWPISKLSRLTDLALDDPGHIEAEVVFDRQGKLRTIQGSVTAQFEVTCQRCMQPMVLELKPNFKLALVTEESQADNLPEGYEPFLVEEDSRMSIPQMLEDELLLAMPLVAMHEHDCSDYLQQQKHRQQQEVELEKTEKEKNNPFSVLKDLL